MRRRCWSLLVTIGVLLAACPSAVAVDESQTETDWIVRFVPGADHAAQARSARADGLAVRFEYGAVFPGMAVRASAAQADALRHSPLVEWIKPDTKVTTDGAIQTLGSAGLWGLDRVDQRVGRNGSYSYGPDGTGVLAYVIDSGIRADHVEFTSRVNPGFTVFDDGLGTADCYGHGTHVSGTLGGTTVGVAKNVRITPVKVLDCTGNGYDSQVIAGIDWVIADHQAGVPAVANISLGTGDAVNSAVQALIADGVTTAVAAGNRSADACTRSPAQVPEALTAAAIDVNDTEASFSNYGPCVDLYAPAVGIASASYLTTDGYVAYKGTSMAAPHVAGAAALILSARGVQSPATVADELLGKATQGVVIGARSANRLLFTSAGSTPAPMPLTTIPQILGVAVVGGWLSASPGPWGPGAVAFTYQWLRNGVPILGATGPGYTPTTSDVGAVLSYRLSATSSDYQPLTAISVQTDPVQPPPAPGTYQPVNPSRVLDTRDGTGTGWPARVGPSGVVTLQVTGTAGVAPGAAAVALNVTAVGGDTAGWVACYPAWTRRPFMSNLNFVPGQAVPNLVIVPVSADGKVSLFNGSGGSVDLVADVAGYWTGGAATLPGTLGTITATRLLDTRSTGSPVPGYGVQSLPVTGVAGVPADASSVIANITVVDPATSGYLTVFPTGTPAPLASNVNFVAGQTVPNLAVAKVGAGGSISIFNGSQGQVHVIVDVLGYFRGGDATAPGTFVAMNPRRVVDTRPVGVGAAQTLGLDPQPVGVPPSARALLANVTVTEPSASGYVTVYPAGQPRPWASNLNFVPGQTVPNLTLTRTGANGDLQLFDGSGGSVQLVADVQGFVN